MTSEENDEKCGFWASFSGPKNSNYKWVSTALVLVFLMVGGFIAWFAMKGAANKLAGGRYNQLSSDSALGGADSAKADKDGGFFATEEELSKADPALKKELLYSSGRTAGQSAQTGTASAGQAAAPAGGAGAGNVSSGQGGSTGAASSASGSGLVEKLTVREIQLGQMKGGGTAKASAFKTDEANGNVSVRPSQSSGGAPGGVSVRAPKTSVLSALRSAFKANLYGARLASGDAAKNWIAKAFDANPDSEYSLEYDEKVKSKLDRINPGSIPKFLRDQDINASEAKSLGVSDVNKPEMDKDATKESLKGDKDYQSKKSSQDLAKALFNPMGPFSSGGGGGGDSASDPASSKSVPKDTGGNDASTFSDPNDTQDLQQIGLEDYIATEGYGAECGCTMDAPCCCLPPNSFTGQQCPMYGPFLPDDPCGAANNVDGAVGDFPPADTGTMIV